MRIGIITIHNSPSYGGCLQSFALYKYLVDCGHDTEIINLLRPANKDYLSSIKHHHIRANCWVKLWSIIKAIFHLKLNDYNQVTYNAEFERFNSQIKLSKVFRSVDELYNNPPAYDVYLTGSDQVWNPSQPYIIEPYFLTFVKDRKGRKISYAASVGLSKLRAKEEILFKKWIEKYDYVSVREQTLKEYLETFVNKNIERVADPTFLLDRTTWKSIAVFPDETQPYILLFALGHNEELISFCMRLSKQAGIQLIVLERKTSLKNEKYKVVNTAGPKEFLGYIGNAEMVITDSFHGTVFSIIMKAKNFYSYISPTNIKGSRITDLLQQHKISDHLLNQDLKQTWAELNGNPINKMELDECYYNEQKISREFLDNSLK